MHILYKYVVYILNRHSQHSKRLVIPCTFLVQKGVCFVMHIIYTQYAL